MSARGTTVAEGFSNKLMQAVYDKHLLDEIVNRNYEGEINGIGSVLNIMDFGKVSEKIYSGSALVADALTENNGQLIIDQEKSFYWKEKVLENWLSYIKDPNPTIIAQTAEERRKNMDLYAFSKFTDIGAGNRIGTNYNAGDVTVTTGTGVVAGNGTTFTAAMVGRGFKATGHSTWYRVKQVNSTTELVIEDDKDDIASAYTGGAIAGGTAYEIEAVTAVTATASTLLGLVGKLKLKLDMAEKNGYNAVPTDGRFLIVPPEFEDMITVATGVALNVPAAYEELVKVGMITMLKGFKVFVSNRLTGNNTDGYHVIAGHANWMTFAEKVLQARMEEDLPGDFGTAYKDLFVYGAKVKDIMRHQAAEMFVKF